MLQVSGVGYWFVGWRLDALAAGGFGGFRVWGWCNVIGFCLCLCCGGLVVAFATGLVCRFEFVLQVRSLVVVVVVAVAAVDLVVW